MSECPFENILKGSLSALYYGDKNFLDTIDKMDFTNVRLEFMSELFSIMSPEEFYNVNDLLHSEQYLLYAEAVSHAIMAVSKKLADIAVFAQANADGVSKH
ncbi:hypothetical protein D3C85_541730 [compost metagenome]